MTEPIMRVQSALTERDMVLLGWLSDHGVLTSTQIAAALYPSVNFAQRRLRKLLALRVVDRFRPQRADGGSYPYHYVLAQLGTEVVAAQRGEDLPRKDQARQRRWHLTNRANLPHLLGINQFFIDLAAYARTNEGVRLSRWWPAARCQGTGAFAEPSDPVDVWAYRASVRPDGHGIWAEGDHTVSFFMEYDTGTEPQHKLIDKIEGYARLARITGRPWPVLFSLHSAARAVNLHRRLAQQLTPVPVATTVRADGRSPAESVWWLHRHEGPLLPMIALRGKETECRRAAAPDRRPVEGNASTPRCGT
ncbi:replication-relaxation family protein [Dactylosporangium sp. NPDC051541]|uniref:replication-relaxation family protein n=1 Tax=Dactylosporangium sp. NPDC051541 TaxID=3363977 RepID=UPI00378D0784